MDQIFFNYKHTFSVVMMALVDVGCQVMEVYFAIPFWAENSLTLPTDETLPSYTQTTFPYVFV